LILGIHSCHLFVSERLKQTAMSCSMIFVIMFCSSQSACSLQNNCRFSKLSVFVENRLHGTLFPLICISPIYQKPCYLSSEGFRTSFPSMKQWPQTASVRERKKNINELELLSGTLFLILYINFGRH